MRPALVSMGCLLLAALAGCIGTATGSLTRAEYAPLAAPRDHGEALHDPRWDDAHDVLVEASARCEERRVALEREYHHAGVVNHVANIVAGVATGGIPLSWGVGPIADRTILAKANAERTFGAMGDALDAAYEWLRARRGRQQWSDDDARAWDAHKSRLGSLCGG